MTLRPCIPLQVSLCVSVSPREGSGCYVVLSLPGVLRAVQDGVRGEGSLCLRKCQRVHGTAAEEWMVIEQDVIFMYPKPFTAAGGVKAFGVWIFFFFLVAVAGA